MHGGTPNLKDYGKIELWEIWQYDISTREFAKIKTVNKNEGPFKVRRSKVIPGLRILSDEIYGEDP